MHYALFYEVVDDYVERRAPLRAEHLDLARAAHARGEILLAGAFANPPDGALFVFSGKVPGAAERFAESDPYVRNGLVKRWWVREWTTVIGEGTPTP